MSSNLKIKKTCEFCKNVFIAKQINTRFCSHICNSRNYKLASKEPPIYERIKKIKEPGKEFLIEEINKKDFLTVKEVSKMLSMSLRTVYRLIETKELNSYNFSIRKTLIRRKDIDSYFEINLQNTDFDKEHMKKYITLENSYSINEVISKYGISNGALYNLLKRLEIPKRTFGKHTLVKKEDIDKIFAP